MFFFTTIVMGLIDWLFDYGVISYGRYFMHLRPGTFSQTKDSPPIDIPPKSDTLFWLQTNQQSLHLLFMSRAWQRSTHYIFFKSLWYDRIRDRFHVTIGYNAFGITKQSLTFFAFRYTPTPAAIFTHQVWGVICYPY